MNNTETKQETFECYWCKSDLTVNDIVISNNGWAYCKKCKKPMLDMHIQPEENFLKRHESEIEHADCIELMMRGYM